MATATRNPAKPGTVRLIRPDTGAVVILPLSTDAQGTPVPVQPQLVGAFPPKQVIGDYQIFHHEYLSGLIQNDWQGGGQIEDANEATDLSRTAGIATTETRYPRKVTLLPLAETVDGPSGTRAVLLGDLQQSLGGAVHAFATYGTDLYRINGTVATDTTLNLSAEPVTEGTAFSGSAGERRLYIPLGAAGYHYYDENSTTLSALFTDVRPLNFVNWDGKLWCLGTNYTVYKNVTGVNTDWVAVCTLDSEGEPKRLVRFLDAFGNPTLFAVTTQEVFVLDVGTGAHYPVLDYAPHPQAGNDAEWWRESLFIAHGIDAARYDRGTISYVGLARDDGVPAEYRGHITALAKGWNDLFALVQGQEIVDDLTEGFESDLDADLLFGADASLGVLMRLDSLGGWHTVWASGAPGKQTTNVVVSRADGEYRLYWAHGGVIRVAALSTAFQNPKQNPLARFALSGTMVSPWFDMQKTGMAMILAAMQVRHQDCTATETLTLRVQLDFPTSPWTTVGTITTDGTEHGMTQFLLGDRGLLPNGETWYEGIEFGRMRYAVDLARDPADDSKSPKLEAVTAVFLPKMGTLQAYTFVVDCDHEQDHTEYGMGDAERIAFLEGLIEEKFIPFNYEGEDWRTIKITGVSRNGAPAGVKKRGHVTVTAIEGFDL